MYCLIYLLKNTVNDKIYVGQTWRPLLKRIYEGYRHSHHISNAIKKYGKDKFYYTVLTVCGTQEIADYWERHFIIKYNSIENGYNLKEGGSNGRLSEQTKLKISEAQSGEKGHWYGKTFSLETKTKMSKAASGENNAFYGETHPEENLIKMRANHKNKPNRFGLEEVNIIKYKANILKMSYSNIGKEYDADRHLISFVVNDSGPYKKG
jgi:group I intron endonuclease